MAARLASYTLVMSLCFMLGATVVAPAARMLISGN